MTTTAAPDGASVTTPVPSLVIAATTEPTLAVDEITPEETGDEKPAAEAADKAAPDKDKPDDEAERDPKTGRFAKRVERMQETVNNLTAQKHQALRDLQQLQREAETLRKQLAEAQPPPADDYNAQETHRLRSAIKTERLEQVEQEAERAAARAHETRASTFMAKVDAAQERIPDIHEALSGLRQLPLSSHAADVIADSDKAAEIAYHLAKNPQRVIEIAAMTPAQQGAAIARIEAQMQIAPQVRKTTQAPAPVPALGGSRSPAVKGPEDMSTEEMSQFLLPKLGRR